MKILKILELFAGTRSIGAAPRGAKTGTQGLKGSKERSVIPRMLCEHIVYICEREVRKWHISAAVTR